MAGQSKSQKPSREAVVVAAAVVGEVDEEGLEVAAEEVDMVVEEGDTEMEEVEVRMYTCSVITLKFRK